VALVLGGLPRIVGSTGFWQAPAGAPARHRAKRLLIAAGLPGQICTDGKASRVRRRCSPRSDPAVAAVMTSRPQGDPATPGRQADRPSHRRVRSNLGVLRLELVCAATGIRISNQNLVVAQAILS